MRALIIGPEDRARIAGLVARADARRVDLARVKRMVARTERPIGDDPDFAVIVPQGYRCVFSVEEQPGGWCRHLSVSILDPVGARRLPSPESIDMLMGEFGFSGRLKPSGRGRLAVWIEEERAINVVEPLTEEGAR